jgi:hypothetical protein
MREREKRDRVRDRGKERESTRERELETVRDRDKDRETHTHMEKRKWAAWSHAYAEPSGGVGGRDSRRRTAAYPLSLAISKAASRN